MDEFPKFPTRSLPQYPDAEEMAEAADIRRPPPRVIRDDEGSAQLQQAKPPVVKEVPRSIAEAAALQKSLEREGRRVEKNSPALQQYLKQGQGDELSADVLATTAALMAALPEQRKTKRKRRRHSYLKWAWGKSTVLVSKVIHVFTKGRH